MSISFCHELHELTRMKTGFFCHEPAYRQTGYPTKHERFRNENRRHWYCVFLYLVCMKKYVFLLLGFAAFHSSAQQVNVSKNIQQAMNRIDTNTIRSHIAYLADDKLKGRLPGTEGYQMAVDYVVEQYKKMGVAPGGDNGGYTQKLVLRRSVLNNKTAVAVLKDKQGNIDSLDFAVDYTAAPHPMLANAAAEGQLVFAGYGVEIPGQYSDYSGIDVKGNINIGDYNRINYGSGFIGTNPSVGNLEITGVYNTKNK